MNRNSSKLTGFVVLPIPQSNRSNQEDGICSRHWHEICLCHASHNFFFMTVDGNSLGTKSLEGLEKGNFTTQVMDAHHTYKGSRKKANKGVFKLLRLKSSRLLREYRRKPPARVQRYSRCHKIGHNAKNKACSAGIIIPDMEVGDAPNIEIFGEGAGLNDTIGTELVTSEEAGQS